MKSITIHQVDDELSARLKELSERRGISTNRLVKSLLREKLRLDQPVINHRSDFEEFFGQWSENESAAFAQSIKSLFQVDEEIRQWSLA